MKKVLTLVVALALVVSTGTMAMAQENDYADSWAKEEIDYMLEKGILTGYPDGSFKPNNNMLKSEFYTVINLLMGYTEKGEVEFSDVDEDDWFYEEVQKGLAANYIMPAEELNAEVNVSRGEVARIISIAFDVEEDVRAASNFEDNQEFSKDMRGVIGGLKARGFISGRPDGTFDAEADITRAEAVKMLYDISGEIINKSEMISDEDISSNMLVNTTGVVLKDMTIAGDLYLTEGIGEGDVVLDGVTVEGHLSIQGGGVESIDIKNSDLNTVSVNKQGNPVRVVFENTKVGEVQAENKAKLELKGETKVATITLDGDLDLDVDEDSTVAKVLANSSDVGIDAEGTIGTITTKEDIKVNGKTLDSGKKFGVQNGKANEKDGRVKDSREDKDTSSSSSSSTAKSRIVSRYEADLKNLESDSRDELREILNDVREEVENSNKSKEKIKEIGKKYMPDAQDLEEDTNEKVEAILSELKNELKDNGYSDSTAENEANGLETIYENKKDNEEQAIRDEFKGEIQVMLEALFLN